MYKVSKDSRGLGIFQWVGNVLSSVGSQDPFVDESIVPSYCHLACVFVLYFPNEAEVSPEYHCFLVRSFRMIGNIFFRINIPVVIVHCFYGGLVEYLGGTDVFSTSDTTGRKMQVVFRCRYGTRSCDRSLLAIRLPTSRKEGLGSEWIDKAQRQVIA